MPLTEDKSWELARRLASLSRWTAALNYMLMYPDADFHYSHYFGPLVETRLEAMKLVSGRLTLHSGAIVEIMKEIESGKDWE